MHELAVCQALLEQVAAVSAKHGGARVRAVTVRIGPLSGVEPRLLADAYDMACAGSAAGGSRLEIEAAPVRVRCRVCAAETDVLPNRLVCGGCGAWQTDLVSGDELMLMRVTLDHAMDPVGAGGESEGCDV